MLHWQPLHLTCTTFTRGHTSTKAYYILHSFMLTYIKRSRNNGGEKLVKVSRASHAQEKTGLFSGQFHQEPIVRTSARSIHAAKTP